MEMKLNGPALSVREGLLDVVRQFFFAFCAIEDVHDSLNFLPQHFRHFHSAPIDPGLYRAYRYANDFNDLLIGKAFQIPENQHFPEILRQSEKSAMNALGQLPLIQNFRRVCKSITCLCNLFMFSFQRIGLSTFRFQFPVMVDDAIATHSHHPCFKGSQFRFVRMQRAIDL